MAILWDLRLVPRGYWGVSCPVSRGRISSRNLFRYTPHSMIILDRLLVVDPYNQEVHGLT